MQRAHHHQGALRFMELDTGTDRLRQLDSATHVLSRSVRDKRENTITRFSRAVSSRYMLAGVMLRP